MKKVSTLICLLLTGAMTILQAQESKDHAYVDLGLPSGTLWATCNVGANAPEEYGDYFAWGETTPKDVYNPSTYLYYKCSNKTKTIIKYYTSAYSSYKGVIDNLATLQPMDDAATANWGDDWRMPTIEEWKELFDNTPHTWTQQNGVNGRLFTASNGNTLFLPAAGCREDSKLIKAGGYGYYWACSILQYQPYEAYYIDFDYNYYHTGYGINRACGLSVRAVRSTAKN